VEQFTTHRHREAGKADQVDQGVAGGVAGGIAGGIAEAAHRTMGMRAAVQEGARTHPAN